jgi:hypothetical protein
MEMAESAINLADACSYQSKVNRLSIGCCCCLFLLFEVPDFQAAIASYGEVSYTAKSALPHQLHYSSHDLKV